MGENLKLRVNNEIPAYRTGLVSALDVGTSKVACVIGRAEHGTLKVLGSALRESAGLKAGTVTSLDLAEETIRDCVAAAEIMPMPASRMCWWRSIAAARFRSPPAP